MRKHKHNVVDQSINLAAELYSRSLFLMFASWITKRPFKFEPNTEYSCTYLLAQAGIGR